MSSMLLIYVGFVEGIIHSTQNTISNAWVLFSPSNELVSSKGNCLKDTTNNVAKYNVIFELLYEDISLGICYFLIKLDSQLVVSAKSYIFCKETYIT